MDKAKVDGGSRVASPGTGLTINQEWQNFFEKTFGGAADPQQEAAGELMRYCFFCGAMMMLVRLRGVALTGDEREFTTWTSARYAELDAFVRTYGTTGN